MLLLPFERLVMHSSLPPDALLRRLEVEVEPRRLFRWWSGDHKPYEGNVAGDSFSIRRIIHHRNSFLPHIRGRVCQQPGGSSVGITMYPRPLTIGFMALWLGGALIALVLLLANHLLAYSRTGAAEALDPASLLAPGGLFVLGYGLLLAGFKPESARSEAFLRDTFQAYRVDDLGLGGLLGAA